MLLEQRHHITALLLKYHYITAKTTNIKTVYKICNHLPSDRNSIAEIKTINRKITTRKQRDTVRKPMTWEHSLPSFWPDDLITAFSG